MKKYIFSVLQLLVFPLLVFSQTGSGTYTDPYTGTLTQSRNWSGTTWVTGDITVNGYTLTFSPGATIVFKATGNFIIAGGGILTADGGPGVNTIRITADFDNDSNYGEVGERWGHISFSSSAGTSLIDNCIIEYGDVSGFAVSDIRGTGGCLTIDFNNLTISNSILRYNKAQWGGGIFVNASRHPLIKNCYIYNNSSLQGGGGIYLWNSASSIIENCIIESNSSGGTAGGGLTSQSSGSIKVINCTFVNNTSAQTTGKGIYLYSSANSIVVNCVFWGSANQALFSGTNAVNYSAFQQQTVSGTGNINLNSDNDALTGPGFTNPTSRVWSIKAPSPLRNAGVDTYAGVIIPTTDYLDNSRVSTTDIGAYEVQYRIWKITAANTDWTDGSNWDGLSASSALVTYIPTGATNYPTYTPVPDVTIGSGQELVIGPGAKATLGTLTNNGSLKLESSSSAISSLIIGSFSGNSANVQLYLTGGYIGKPALRVGRWHYISSPFDPSTPLSISPFTANTYDLARWKDGIQSPASILLGFVGFDGYVYNDSDPSDPGTFWGGTFSTLITGRGYNFWDNLSSFNYSLTGKLNTSDVAVNLDFAGAAYENGYNLLGNPFSSGLNWDDIINSVYFTYPSNTSKSLYFTRDNVSCTYIAGVGVPGDVTGLIPPMQGFFTKTYSTGNVITLAAAARVNDDIHARYKGQTIIPLVRLEIDKDSLSKDETVVRFDDKALTTLDNEFDALKMFLSASTTAIYSSDGVSKYSINGQPFPGTAIEIPVVINLQYSGNHKISTNQLQGLDNYYVTLKDNTTGFIADLKTTPELSFSAAAGTTSGRFILKITNLTTGVENPVVSNNIFNIYPGQNLINIQTIANEWDGRYGSVRLLDLTGKTLTDLQNAEFRKNSVIQMQVPAATGLYVVEIRSGVKRYVGKVVIK